MATALSFYYPTEPGVFASHGQSISLKSVSIKGEIKGLSLKLSVRQSYQNDTGENLEIVYVFPVAYGCELMGLKVTHNGKAKTGKVYPKKTAWQKYEEAIDEGDSPILVETNSPGLFTANLGNVLPGDEIQVEYSYFELLKFEVDQIRVVVPTTVAPRYGDLKETGELKEHESIEPSLTARYPLELAIDVVGDLAESSISSPNHSIETSFAPGLATVALANGAIMDRDFVLILKRVKALEKSFALCAYDPVEKRHAVLASFCPTVPGLTEPIALKILVDCSGSMAGSSIAEAVRGLGSVIDRLTPDDYVAYSRFGSDVIHDSRKLLRCDSKNLRILREFVSQTDANLGGTELLPALRSVLKLDRDGAKAPANAAVLLITDGETAGLMALVELAKKSGQRIFTIGVGYSPAESLLAKLAEATGGASEMVSPNENVAKAVDRLFRRLRVDPAKEVKIDWGAEPKWASKAPISFFSDETIHAFATFAEKPASLPKLTWQDQNGPRELSPASWLETRDPELPRMVALNQIFALGDHDGLNGEEIKEALAAERDLAVRHQLLTAQTAYFLVSERADDDKADALPTLQNVPQTLAHDWHGLRDFDVVYNKLPYFASFELVEAGKFYQKCTGKKRLIKRCAPSRCIYPSKTVISRQNEIPFELFANIDPVRRSHIDPQKRLLDLAEIAKALNGPQSDLKAGLWALSHEAFKRFKAQAVGVKGAARLELLGRAIDEAANDSPIKVAFERMKNRHAELANESPNPPKSPFVGVLAILAIFLKSFEDELDGESAKLANTIEAGWKTLRISAFLAYDYLEIAIVAYLEAIAKSS